MAEIELMQAIQGVTAVALIPLILLVIPLLVPIPIAMIIGALRKPKDPVKLPRGLRDPIVTVLLSWPLLWIVFGEWEFLNGKKGSHTRALYEFLELYDFDTRENLSILPMLIAVVCLYYTLIVGFRSLFKASSKLRPLLALTALYCTLFVMAGYMM